jgi:8-oxo-dGTP diphosphatase
VVNWFWRITYWLGFRAARVWWWMRRPDHHGAVVAIWCDERILMVRQSYRRSPSIPGGGINRGEDPRDAACRELVEELGLVAQPGDLTLVREMVLDWDFRRDHVRIFEMGLNAEPELRIDYREIVAAQFVNPATLLADPSISPVIRTYLQYRPHATPGYCQDNR